MNLAFTARFDRSLREAAPMVQRAFWKQSRFLLNALRHPSLRAKKVDETRDIWQARVNRDWRFFFKILGNDYYLLDITPHPK
jgi:plasmid maintenance system killer protein